MIEHRYESSGKRWRLDSYHPGLVSRAGLLQGDKRPDWLMDILDVAKVGGHGELLGDKFVMWFLTTDDHVLKKFITIGENKSLELDDARLSN